MNRIAITLLLISCSFPFMSKANPDPPPPLLLSWGESGAGDGQFNQPHGIAFNSVGNAHIADMANNRIQVFTSDGQFVQQIGTYGSPEERLSNPLAIAIGSNDYLYVADTGNDRIVKFTWRGDFVLSWGSTGDGNGQFRKPTDITIDSTGDVLVTDQFNDRVQKFNSSGVYVTQWGSSGGDAGEFNAPEGIAVDSQNNVYVTEFTGHRVQKFTSDGEFISTWGNFGTGPGQFSGPAGIALDSLDNVYIAEENNERIQLFTSDGAFRTQWNGADDEQEQFRGLRRLGFNAVNNTLYTSEIDAQRIRVFDTTSYSALPPSSPRRSTFDNSLAIEISRETVCVLNADRRLQCWVVGSPRIYSARFFTHQEINSILGGDIQSFSLGANHVCAIDSLGTIVCEGAGEDDSNPGEVPDDAAAFRQVSAGRNNTCAIQTDDRVRCWGDNQRLLAIPAEAEHLKQVSVFEDYRACGITLQDQAVCWGEYSEQPLSRAIPSDWNAVLDVQSDWGRICALKLNGELHCVSESQPPQALPGAHVKLAMHSSVLCTVTDSGVTQCSNGYEPLVPASFGTAVTLDASGNHACGINTNGHWQCWGDTAWRSQRSLSDPFPDAPVNLSAVEYGDSTVELFWDRPPVPDNLQRFGGRVITGYEIYRDGELVAVIGADTSYLDQTATRGRDHVYEVVAVNEGFASEPSVAGGELQYTPRPMNGGINTAPDISIGYDHACLLQANGDTICWGANDEGQLDNPLIQGGVTAIEAGKAVSCAVSALGQAVICWGDRDNAAIQIPAELSNVRSLAVGPDFACAVDSDGGLRCWGESHLSAVSDAPTDGRFSKVVTNAFAGHACALTIDEQLRCWGDNEHGQSFSFNAAQPYLDVAVGGQFTCVISTQGGVICFGNNELGQTKVPPLSGNSHRLDAGESHTCALSAAGAVTCWGDDAFAQSSSSPLANDQLGVAAGRDDSCSVGADNRLTCWGDASLPFPPAATDLSASIYSRNTVELFWSGDFASTSIAGFEIYRDGEFLAFTTRHSYLDEQLESGRTWQYAVYAVNRSRIRSLEAPIIDVDLENP